MSSQTSCIYGYGFHIYASNEELKQFILKHKETVESLNEGMRLVNYCESTSDDEFNPKEDFFDWENEVTGAEGIYGIIADVMYKETGIMFEYHNAQAEDDNAIILPEMYPWQMNKIEKTLTMDKLENICKDYINDLGGHLEADYIRLEYWG